MAETQSMNWISIGSCADEVRYRWLEEYFKSVGFANAYECVEVLPDDFEGVLGTHLKSCDQIRVATPLGEPIMHYFKVHEALMSQIEAADCIVKDGRGRWWCRSLVYHAISQCLLRRSKKIRTEGSVLIIGAGAAARAVLNSCSRLGFRSFKFTNRSMENAERLIAYFKKQSWNIDLEYVSPERLIHLPGEMSLVVNTTPISNSNSLVEDLYYFNYMRQDGLLIDFNLKPPVTKLLKEYLDIRGDVVFGYEIAAIVDSLWSAWISGPHLDDKTLAEFYLSKASAL